MTQSGRDSEDADQAGIPAGVTFYAYAIRSLNFDFYYKGHCQDLNERLRQHNSGMTQSIRKFIPFKIAYFEKFESREAAIKGEKYFKSVAGRRFLKKKLDRPTDLGRRDSEDAGSLPE